MASEAFHALNLRFASIDIIEANGEFKVLEINSGIMMEYFSETSEENYKLAKGIYTEASKAMFA